MIYTDEQLKWKKADGSFYCVTCNKRLSDHEVHWNGTNPVMPTCFEHRGGSAVQSFPKVKK